MLDGTRWMARVFIRMGAFKKSVTIIAFMQIPLTKHDKKCLSNKSIALVILEKNVVNSSICYNH